MRKTVLRIGVTFICLAAVLAGFEIYLRRIFTHVEDQNRKKAGFNIESDPRFLFEYTPKGRRLLPNRDVIIRNHIISALDVPVTTNSIGFRGPEISLEKQPGQERILLLGDSITIADYLPLGETFGGVMERSLLERRPGRDIQVINAGVGDIGISEEMDILEERGLQLGPDTVILNFYLNDSRPSWGFQNEIVHRGWLRRHSLLAEVIYTRMALAKWVSEQGADRFAWIDAQNSLDWREKEGDFRELTRLAASDWGAAWDESSWKTISDNLDRLKSLSALHGFRVIVAVFPVSFQVYADKPDSSPQEKIRSLAAGNGFGVIDLLPVLRSHKDKQLFFDQCHPNKEGNRIIGEFMAGELGDI